MAEQESGQQETKSTGAEVAGADLMLALWVSDPSDEIELAVGALGLPVLVCLEGGYHLEAMGSCAAAFTAGLSPALP